MKYITIPLIAIIICLGLIISFFSATFQWLEEKIFGIADYLLKV